MELRMLFRGDLGLGMLVREGKEEESRMGWYGVISMWKCARNGRCNRNGDFRQWKRRAGRAVWGRKYPPETKRSRDRTARDKLLIGREGGRKEAETQLFHLKKHH